MSSKEAWKSTRDSFIQEVCASAELMLGGFRSKEPLDCGDCASGGLPKKRNFSFAGAMPQPSEIMGTPVHLIAWSRSEQCFLFVTDSKSLADVVCGRAALQHDRDAPLLERIVDGIRALYDFGW